MADENQEQEQEQESQRAARVANELPSGVHTVAPAIEEHQSENEQAKDKLAEFGEWDVEHFVHKVLSSHVYGRQAIRKLLGLDQNKLFINPHTHTSPQGGNIVGELDHSTWPPTLKGAKK